VLRPDETANRSIQTAARVTPVHLTLKRHLNHKEHEDCEEQQRVVPKMDVTLLVSRGRFMNRPYKIFVISVIFVVKCFL